VISYNLQQIYNTTKMVSKEMSYVIKNKENLEKEHGGDYIAVYQKKVVAIARTIHEIYESLKKLNIKNPLIVYIPKEGEEALLI